MILLVMTDGRLDCIEQTVHSALLALECEITYRVIHDDTGDNSHRDQLRRMFPSFAVIGQPTRQGFGGAIQSAWAHIASRPERFVFHLEDDFTFNEAVPLNRMADVLDANPHVQQMALRRQPWNPEERAAGGIVEQHPDEYAEHTDGESQWLEHRRFFTTNPSLYRRTLCERGWPNGKHSEGRFGIGLCEDPAVRFGYWGTKDSEPKVHHIGLERAGMGY